METNTGEPSAEARQPGADAPPISEEILVRAACPPDFIATLTPADGFGRIVRPSRMQETFLRVAERESGDVVLAVAPPDRIVGYVLIDRPQPSEWQGRRFHDRWEQCEAIWLLGSIEVSEHYRTQRLGTRLLHAAFADGRYDDRIVVTEIIRWHWDLSGTGLTALEYRKRLLDLLGRFGFADYPTDGKEVRADEANALAARLGSQVAPEHVQHFHGLRFVSRRTALPGQEGDGDGR